MGAMNGWKVDGMDGMDCILSQMQAHKRIWRMNNIIEIERLDFCSNF